MRKECEKQLVSVLFNQKVCSNYWRWWCCDQPAWPQIIPSMDDLPDHKADITLLPTAHPPLATKWGGLLQCISMFANTNVGKVKMSGF